VSLFEFLYQARGENGATVLCYGKVYTDKMTTVMTVSASGVMAMANCLSRACEIGLRRAAAAEHDDCGRL